jgi:Peptidase A4 family
MRTAIKFFAIAAVLAATAFAAPAMAGSSPVPHAYTRAPASHALRVIRPPMPFHPHPLIVQPGAAKGFAVVSSGNWSGFAAHGTQFTSVSATWSVPSLNCAVSPDGSQVGQWVGLDGYGTTTVEQTGTAAGCSGGVPTYWAWYEMYPLAPVTLAGVGPGDAITASVAYHPALKEWRLILTDLTNGGHSTETLPCPSGSVCRNASAETISETPGGGPPTVTMPNYAQIAFDHNSLLDSAGVRGDYSTTAWLTDRVNEVDVNNGDNRMQTPSPLEGGQAFTIAAVASS